MKTIVVATDFSERGMNAVNYAADFAVATSCNLAIVHVVSIPVAFSEVPDVSYNLSEMLADAEDSMNRLKEEIASRTGNKVRIKTEVKEGDVITEIEQFCKEVHPVLLVMGAESGDPLERFFMRTHTFSAVKEIRIPVLVIPPGKIFSSVRRIGLACDFHEVTETTPVEEIKTWVRDFNAELHILHVSELKKEDYSSQVKIGSDWLHTVMNELHPDYHFIRHQDVDEALLERIDNNRLDMLIMIARRHRGIEKFFHRSHIRQILVRATVPVMVFPEDEGGRP